MKITTLVSVVALGALLATVGCQPAQEETADMAATDHSMAATDHSMAAVPPDTTGASVWAFLQEVGYASNWDLWPGKGRLYTGGEPHGMLLTTYLNDVAMSAVTTHAGTMPAGAIVVKENYMPDGTLAAVTVMYKVPGYNSEHGDWFFSKHTPSGELDKMPNGMAMEGRLPGCQNCHGGVRANDYIFTSSLSTGGG